MRTNLFILSFFSLLLFTACNAGDASNTTDTTSEAAQPTAVNVSNPSATTPEVAEGEVPQFKKSEAKIAQPANPQVEEAKRVAQQSSQEMKKEMVDNKLKKEQAKKVTREEAIAQRTKLIEEQSTATATTATAETKPAPQAEVKTEKPTPPPAAAKPSHSEWDALLRQNVSSSGKVNYKGFKANLGKLDAYLEQLAKNPIQSDWSRGEKMAYWINAYNAFTVKLILDNYPLSSITKLHSGKPWDVKWIKLGDKTYSLNNIENDILRPQYKDARIHFAVNCAARSCPPLLNRAWTASNLNSNFEKQAKAFVNNAKFNQIGADKVMLSKIFDWYGGDFGNLIDYLNKYAATKINSGAKVEFMEYDWALNE